MKKIISILIAVLAISFSASAQDFQRDHNAPDARYEQQKMRKHKNYKKKMMHQREMKAYHQFKYHKAQRKIARLKMQSMRHKKAMRMHERKLRKHHHRY